MQKIFWLVTLILSGNHAKLCSCFYSNYAFLHLEGIWTRSILMLIKLLLIAILRHSWPLHFYLLIISYLSFVFFPSIYLHNLIKFLLNLKEPLYCSPLFKNKLYCLFAPTFLFLDRMTYTWVLYVLIESMWQRCLYGGSAGDFSISQDLVVNLIVFLPVIYPLILIKIPVILLQRSHYILSQKMLNFYTSIVASWFPRGLSQIKDFLWHRRYSSA